MSKKQVNLSQFFSHTGALEALTKEMGEEFVESLFKGCTKCEKKLPGQVDKWVEELRKRPRENPGEVLKITDGDTLDVRLDIGFYLDLRATIRLLGINAPELNKKAEREAGLKAKECLENLLPLGSWVIVKTFKKGKYGRWIGSIARREAEDTYVDIGYVLVETGNAVLKDY